jgi:hypothetical protein
MFNIELCLQNKIANSSKLRPTILKAILNLFNRGISKMTAEMVKNECLVLDISKPWNDRIPAICLSMKNATECGGRIIGEDRDFLGFTIDFDGNAINLDLSTPKKTSQKGKSNKKDKSNSSSITTYTNEIEIEKLNLSKNFKVVMICAGDKHNSFFKSYPKENFVNKPELANEHHPDDKMHNKQTSWRDYLIKNQSDTNLKKAFELYNPTKTKYPNIYINLFNRYKSNFFILSAGWGLVNSDYRLPKYDVTFSSGKKILDKTRRKKKSIYNDFNQFYDDNKKLLINPEEDILFIGGKNYLELFYAFTRNLSNRKIIYYKGTLPTNQPLNYQNFIIRKYHHSKPKTRTNWHYELAYKIANGIIP